MAVVDPFSETTLPLSAESGHPTDTTSRLSSRDADIASLINAPATNPSRLWINDYPRGIARLGL